MKKLLILLIGILLFSVLAYFCIYKYTAQKIESNIKNKAEDSLIRNNLPSVKVAADGLDITLQGVVASEALKAKAERVAAVDGYHKVNNLIDVAKEHAPPKPVYIEPYSMVIGLNDEKSVVLSGSVPNINLKNKLLSLANSQYGKPHVTDDLMIKAKAPSNWEIALMSVLDVFPLMQRAQLEILGEELTLSGVTMNEASREQIRASLEQALPENYVGSLDISVATQGKGGNEKVSSSNTQAAINCQKEFKKLLSKNNIRFKTGRAEIAKNSTSLLDKLSKTAKDCPKQTIVVTGHTDSQGSKEANKELSKERAQAVVSYLQKKGINKNNLKAKGQGEEKPIATNKTSKGRALNRRIEFVVEGVKS